MVSVIYLFISIIGIIVFGIIGFNFFVHYKVLEKMGRPGWAAFIPFYYNVVLFEGIGLNWYYIFLLFVSGIPVIGNIVFLLFSIYYNIKLGKCFGKTEGFGVGLALVNIVFMAIIAFDKKIKYIGKTVNGDIDFNDLF